MNKAFEKILDRLEEKLKKSEERYHRYLDDSNLSCMFDRSDIEEKRVDTIKEILEIVQEVAEEYKDGWIPSIERLPEDDSICMVTVEYPNNETVVDYGWFDRKNVCWFVGMQEFRTSNIIAWQQLPEPFKEKTNDK